MSRLATLLRRVVKASWLKETLLAVPRIALLVPKLMSDARVPKRTKLALGGLAVYLASPWDLIPDFIPGLGQLDDAVILEHWTGEVETLRRVQGFSRFLSRWTPQGLKAYLFGQAVAVGEKRTDPKSPDR